MNLNNITRNTNLHVKEECPFCHFIFVVGYDPNGIRECPTCNSQFHSGQKINHGEGCSICLNKYSNSNNLYHNDGCPAIMSDGRFITYYNSTNELTEKMRKLNNIESSNEFRTFMQKHGDKFISAERDHVYKENTCYPKIACSEGWHKLWTEHGGNWANIEQIPKPYNY